MQGDATVETELTRDVGRALTPDYASPEQFGGGPIGTASDRLFLGVVAFELLAGVRPYRLKRAARRPRGSRGEHRSAARQQRRRRARRPTALRGDLDAVLNKALKRTRAALPVDRRALPTTSRGTGAGAGARQPDRAATESASSSSGIVCRCWPAPRSRPAWSSARPPRCSRRARGAWPGGPCRADVGVRPVALPQRRARQERPRQDRRRP